MSSKQKSILLVEDHPLVRKISIVILENLNCIVDSVTTGIEAINFCNQQNYDIILMDIGLPDMNGLSVISRIRKNSLLNKNTPIIALTAHSDKEYIQQSFVMGANDFLVKPLNYELGKTILHKYANENYKTFLTVTSPDENALT